MSNYIIYKEEKYILCIRMKIRGDTSIVTNLIKYSTIDDSGGNLDLIPQGKTY